MARIGLSKSQVKDTRAQLIAAGRYPSVDAVREALGNTGSKSTIHKHLKELEREDGAAVERRDDSARVLHALVEQLAERLHLDAERRVQAMRAEYELALQHKDAELAALRAQLALPLQDRPADVVPAASVAPGRKSLREIGFGLFGNLLAGSRNGGRDASPFSSIATSGRSDVVDINELRPAGLQFNN
jgi:biotin operon repressor